MELIGTDYDLAGRVIGLAMRVHRTLGNGFLESVYGNALALELRHEGFEFIREPLLQVLYRDEVVGEFRADFLVASELIVELKAILALNPSHEVQLVNYLSATGVETGLLLNFGAPSLQFKRRVRSLSGSIVSNSVNSVNSV